MIANCDTPGLLPISDALHAMLAAITAIDDSHWCPLSNASGRIVAVDVISPVMVPPADNSAMDGYALRADDLAAGDTLKLIGTALAGTPFSGQVHQGQCVRIMTGAIIPVGADTVVMQENTRTLKATDADSDHLATIEFLQHPKPGNSIRRTGEDITQGQIILSKGCRLQPAHLALLASVGVSQLQVIRRIKVGLIATGDELTPPGETLKPGAIYESNAYALSAMLKEFGADVINFGIVADDKALLQEAFIQADKACDLVISSGGVSVGEADHVKDILQQLGQVNFWKVAIKPGKPFAFGKLSQAWFCGLPGNPVSSYVTFEQLVKPLLEKLAAQAARPPEYFIASATCDIKKRPGRADYQRGIYFRDNKGTLWVKPFAKQGSGIMSSITQANCYLVLAQDCSNIAQGQPVTIQPFNTLAY
ncbi:MAG: molybdopterin molybdotransferase [Paraglaciecola sp.]|jgi:molybdopterin molybdotransferase